MSTRTSTSTRTRPARERGTWICDNCRGRSGGLRKRCADCGTSRY